MSQVYFTQYITGRGKINENELCVEKFLSSFKILNQFDSNQRLNFNHNRYYSDEKISKVINQFPLLK